MKRLPVYLSAALLATASFSTLAATAVDRQEAQGAATYRQRLGDKCERLSG